MVPVILVHGPPALMVDSCHWLVPLAFPVTVSTGVPDEQKLVMFELRVPAMAAERVLTTGVIASLLVLASVAQVVNALKV